MIFTLRHIFILGILVAGISPQKICTGYMQQTIQVSYYYELDVLEWFIRYRIGYQKRLKYHCCSDYDNYPDCDPKCNGLTKLNGACEEKYISDRIEYRNGSTRDNGGGTCVSPNNCMHCQDGFYGNGGHCLICPPIAHCYHRRCDNPSDNHCRYCHYEIADKRYFRGYTHHYDGQMKQCRKACSWRSDSTRCYPGICTDEIVESCSCTSGFGGYQCDIITEETSILYAEIKLHNPSNEIVVTPSDPNDPGPQPIRFTNKDSLNAAEIEMRAKFETSGTPPKPEADHYITEFKYGIVYGEMKFEYIKSPLNIVLTYSCPATEDYPININYNCSRTHVNSSDITIPTFSQAEKLVFTIEVRNGGYLKYINRENNIVYRVSLKGKTTTRSYTIQWDYIEPYYTCLQQYGTSCDVPPLDLKDVTDENYIALSWRQWSDDLAGIEFYEYEVFHLAHDGAFLKEAGRMFLSNRTQPESEFNVTIPGMYSVIFTAFDKAGNYKSTRSVFLFDDQSVVETTSGTRLIVTESTSETNYTWVVTDTSQLHVKWPGRFINERHDVNGWLEPVAKHTSIETVYDDIFGRRTVQWYTNIKGVVKFDINYTVTGTDVSSFQSFSDVPDILQESEVIDVTWQDGQKLDITVRATDIIGKYTDDTITIYKDTTNPEIENLWLSYGNKTDLFVQRLEDFTTMRFEWDAFDNHSGIHSVQWKLFDNYTGSDEIHGQSHIHAQGNVDNMTSCEEEYQDHPRGPDCYCTLYHGCFHRHFHIKPQIVDGAGLIPGKDKGVHDSDYFIEITIVNKAFLKKAGPDIFGKTEFVTGKMFRHEIIVYHKTKSLKYENCFNVVSEKVHSSTKLITIDISAPQPGFVHDGIYGSPEIDYQIDMHLNVHWDGFFDPESSVKYYKYIFSDHCWDREELFDSNEGIETLETIASYDAVDEGTYFVTVIAMNPANDASRAVCSDGVTIVTTKPSVKNVVLNGAKTYPHLVMDDNGTKWIIRTDITRTMAKSSDTCNTDATNVEDIRLFPEKVVTQINCSDLSPVTPMFLFVLPRSSQLTMTWEPDVENELIYDYEIGLSSTKNSLVPDLVPYRSTKHHQHFRLNNPDLTEGTLFYVVIKTTSKANIEGIQSFGPIIVDVTAPTFTGSHIDVRLDEELLTLVVNWSSDSFQDEEDPYPLTYQYALGHVAGGTDIAGFQPLTYNKHCVRTIPPECTAIDLLSLEWTLHGNHDYYVTIKVTNLAGLTTTHTSVIYTHDVQPPSPGVVLDINPTNIDNRQLQDIVDVDFSIVSDKLSVEWNNFHHPHLDLYFNVCAGTTIGGCDVTMEKRIDGSISKHTFNNLVLTVLQTYYITVEAIAKTGSVNVTSDGVTIVDNKTELTGLIINDGPICSDKVVLNGSHHDMDVIPICESDIDYQVSTSTLEANWEVPANYKDIIRSTFWSIDKKSPVGDVWSQYREFTYIGSDTSFMTGELDLQPGLTYRSTIKLCADDICFPASHSDGVVIVPNKPVTGLLEVQLDGLKMTVIFKTMYDPDIEDMSEAIDAVTLYEWTIVDGSYGEGMYENWRIVNNLQKINNTHSKFEIVLTGEIDFAKCKHMNVKGYNNVGVWSEISTEIKQCHVEDGHSHIVPRMIIDATGISDKRGIGKGIYLEENTAWTLPDVDYTPYQNILSAVWPSLRHKSYNWGVLIVDVNNADTFYKDFTEVLITDPCSHPKTIKCGITERTFINVQLNESEFLVHGQRYAVCVHAAITKIQHKKGTETLDEVNSCSDGVTVDLTPPVPGKVWIGSDPNTLFQTSSSDIVVSWDSFVDVEEQGRSMHSSGITRYMVSIGSIDGGIDIVDKENVGVTNRVSFHGLKLQNGHKYYVTLMGYDFINRSTEVHASPVTVDVSPPEVTKESVLVSGRMLANISEVEACWTNVFEDIESGIDYFMWGVGSQAGQDDVIPFVVTAQQCGVGLEDKNLFLTEGHAYFITVKAFNRAGFSTTKSSWAYNHERSPPYAGHVYDRALYTSVTHSKDIDYQTDMTKLSVYWEGFHDPHSAIKYYNVHIGKCPGCDDVVAQQYVGIHTEFTITNINLETGAKYYSTITACNTADLCTSVMSDGVVIDNSPPVPGIVQDGVDELDIEYQSIRNYLAAKWFGFVDSQSGIDVYVIRVGTAHGSGVIMSSTVVTETDAIFMTYLSDLLPLNRRIYITVRAYNKAGLFSESTSNGFFIDISAPHIIAKPFMSRDLGSINDGTSILRSAIRFKWEVEDRQSFIQKQFISVSSHNGGEFNNSSVMVNGIVREYTLTNLNLYDGGIYIFKLIVCNGAKICTETQSDGILVDHSPPTSGMFAISTYHAAELQRHTPGWMSWSEYRLNISWLGFTDFHCKVDKYFVSVGSQYMSNDLNKVPGQPMEFNHNQSGIQYKDEGPIQYFTVQTQRLEGYEYAYISVWAVNEVGLRSSMIHYQFQLIPGGFLDLIRRCTAHTCLGHCVCSPRDKQCILNGEACTDVTSDNRNTLISVNDVIDLIGTTNDDVDFIPSNSLLSAKWKVYKQQGLSPLWYEWSVGLTSQDKPEGVIDTTIDPLWHHAGKNMEAIYCLKQGQRLTELLTYSVFVTVWYSQSVYAVFKSSGVTVISKPMPVNDHSGAAVKEKIPKFWKNDVDFIKPGALFTITWENVFLAQPGSVKDFNVYISSFPGGSYLVVYSRLTGADLHKVDLDIASSVSAVNISRLSMSPGVRYYSNVVANTLSGLQTTVSSDGIMVDSTSPVSGTVYDGVGMCDLQYQNKSDIVAATWHGLTDMESGIVQYLWCVDKGDQHCGIVPWTNVGMHTSVSTKLHQSVVNGDTVYSRIKAIDGVGHSSDIKSTNGVTIDTTPPVPISYRHNDNNLVMNPSFEETKGCLLDITNISTYNLCTNDDCYQPIKWSKVGCITTISSDVDTAYHERSFIFLSGSVQQSIQDLTPGDLYRVSFVTSHPPISTAVISNLEGSVKFDNKEHLFHIYTKDKPNEIVWQLHMFYFRPTSDNCNITISNLNRNNGFLLDDIKVQVVETSPENEGGLAVHVNTVILHQWSSIHASWNFVDAESPITEYLWAIGSTKGNAEIQNFKSVGLNNFGYNYNVTLAHSSQVYITVVAINNAGLHSKAYSTGINIDRTPPVIPYVNDGTGVDVDSQTSNVISSNWEVTDPDSNIDFCEWSIGIQPYGNKLQAFTKTVNLKSASTVFDENIIAMTTIYTTIRCHNNAGSYTTATSDGLTISKVPPSSDNAVIAILPISKTEYGTSDYHQRDPTKIRMKWSGFTDRFDIMSFVVQFEGGSLHLKKIPVLDINKEVSYMVMSGLDLSDEAYTASVTAINAMYVRSNKTCTNITTQSSSPTIVDGSKIETTKNGDVLIVSWNNVFTYLGRLTYEVSVGTTQGGADVIQWQETLNDYMEVSIPEKFKGQSSLNLFFFVRAIGDNGEHTDISNDITV